MPSEPVAYFVFDVEAVGDGELIAKVRYPSEDLSPEEALARYRAELLEKAGRDVLPPTFVLPVSVAVAKVARDYRLLEVITIDAPDYRPPAIVRDFWRGWRRYGMPTFVTFNGRGYDMPVLELGAFRYGIAVKEWFNVDARSFEKRRNRYNHASHLDLMDFIGNFGANRVIGGLNLMANLIGKPGKTGIDGSQVQEMYVRGEMAAINDYCVCDVLDTYFVFLRSRVLTGHLTLEKEQELIAGARQWIEAQQDSAACRHYLEHWGDWVPPEIDVAPQPAGE